MLIEKKEKEKLRDVWINKGKKKDTYLPKSAMETSEEHDIFLYLSFYGAVRSNTIRKLNKGDAPLGISQEAWENQTPFFIFHIHQLFPSPKTTSNDLRPTQTNPES